MAVIFTAMFFISCRLQPQKIKGFWENEEKILKFDDDFFVIYNKKSQDVIAFSGTYSYATEPSNAIIMKYLQYFSSEARWETLEGTELEGYKDVLLFKISGDTLVTKVIGNNECYYYKRCSEPSDEKLQELRKKLENQEQ